MTQRKAWGIGAALAGIVGLTGAGLELWPDPAPCRPCIVRVGETPAYCPDERHTWRETWSDDWSALHLECLCP